MTPERNAQSSTLLTIDQDRENPNPGLSLKEKGPSIYSDKISLDKGKFLVTNNGIYQPDATAPTEIVAIDPHVLPIKRKDIQTSYQEPAFAMLV